MSDVTAPRYGYQPTAAFAATRAYADHRREQIGSAPSTPRPRVNVFHRLTALVLRSA